MSNRSGGPGPPLFSVFCFSKRPPARHPEVARPPTDPEIKKRRPGARGLLPPAPRGLVCSHFPLPGLNRGRTNLRWMRWGEEGRCACGHSSCCPLILDFEHLRNCAILSTSLGAASPDARGNCDPAISPPWTGALGRWRGVPPFTRRGRSCLCASWGGTKLRKWKNQGFVTRAVPQ